MDEAGGRGGGTDLEGRLCLSVSKNNAAAQETQPEAISRLEHETGQAAAFLTFGKDLQCEVAHRL